MRKSFEQKLGIILCSFHTNYAESSLFREAKQKEKKNRESVWASIVVGHPDVLHKQCMNAKNQMIWDEERRREKEREK